MSWLLRGRVRRRAATAVPRRPRRARAGRAGRGDRRWGGPESRSPWKTVAGVVGDIARRLDDHLDAEGLLLRHGISFGREAPAGRLASRPGCGCARGRASPSPPALDRLGDPRSELLVEREGDLGELSRAVGLGEGLEGGADLGECIAEPLLEGARHGRGSLGPVFDQRAQALRSTVASWDFSVAGGSTIGSSRSRPAPLASQGLSEVVSES